MTPAQREWILSLTITPDGHRGRSPEQVLRKFGASDGKELGLSLLRDAIGRRDPIDVELSLMACSAFGVTTGHLDELRQLIATDWHTSHEDVVTQLGRYQSPDAVDALFGATQWVPEYLAFDDSRALAVKAIWALGETPGPEAERALSQLLDSDDEILREGAERQIERRSET